MNIFTHYGSEIAAVLVALTAEGALPGGLDLSRVAVDPPRDPSHGDLSTNAAMVLAKPAGMNPRDLATVIASRLASADGVMATEIAGPGFINLRLDDSVWWRSLADILAEGTAYGASDIGAGERVNVEFVSANPTGPMHVGHARGAVVGDVLATLLEKAGYSVVREYYINDAGEQVNVLGRSAFLRYREALGEAVGDIPAGLYPGDYLVPVGRALAEKYGGRWIGRDEAEWLPEIRAFAIDAMMEMIRADLAAFSVRHDVFTSERGLVESGKVDAALQTLSNKGLIYTGVLDPPKGKIPDDWEPREQTLFRSTAFGDEVDRPLKKSDGSWTYFASDIAYHLDKYQRGSKVLVDVWGADHGGHIRRMKAALQAMSEGQAEMDVKLIQIVKLLDRGEPVKMSKRAGTFVTLRDLIEDVGPGVVRFIMLTRSSDAPLDFDLAKVKEQSRDNPVFYVQYAHARCHSVAKMAGEAYPDLTGTDGRDATLSLLADEMELALVKLLTQWPRTVEAAARAHEPHRIAYYLHDVAAAFHGLWTKGREQTDLRVIVDDNRPLTEARLALVNGVRIVIASGLELMGVTPVEELR